MLGRPLSKSLHWTDRDMKALRGRDTCPRTHSRLVRGGWIPVILRGRSGLFPACLTKNRVEVMGLAGRGGSGR